MASTHGHTSGLDAHGITTTGQVHWNLTAPLLYEHALRRNEGMVAAEGPLVCRTGQHTGRSPNDKFIVREPSSEAHCLGQGQPADVARAVRDPAAADIVAHLRGQELFVQDCYAGADPAYRLPVRVVSELRLAQPVRPQPVHRPDARRTGRASSREFTVIDAPSFQADPARHGTRSDVVVALNIGAKRKC